MRVLIGRMAAREPWWAEWWSAAAAIAWCGFASVFTAGLEGLPAFRAVTSIAPAWVWYLFSLVLPGLQMLALRADRRPARLAFCAVMAWWWGFLMLAVMVSAPAAPGIVLYGTFCAINLYSLWRLRTT